MKRKNLKLSSMIILVSALTVLSSCETSARYIGSNSWEGSVSQETSETHIHEGWIEINNSNVDNIWSLLNESGNASFYLTSNISVSDIWIGNETYHPDITLCLNGYNITANGTSEYSVINIQYGAALTLMDCQGGGTISGGSASSGGGISINGYNGTSSFTMNGGIISGNTATYDGGGIYGYESDITINGGTISGNSAEQGGGIYNDNGSLTINGGEISGNSADSGAGIYSKSQSTSISGATISGNTALYDAGGVKFEHYEEETEENANLVLGGSTIVSGNYSLNGDELDTNKVEYNVEIDEYSLISLNGLMSGSSIGLTYTNLYGGTYKISTNYDNSDPSYFYVDQNSDYSEYYTVAVDASNSYLQLVYKDGLGDYQTTIPVTLEFTFTYDGEVDTSFPTGYGELYIKGDWDNYEAHDLEYNTETYVFSITLNMSVDIHYYELHLSYLNNQDDYPLYDYDTDGQLSFKIPASSSGSSGVTYSFELEMDDSFDSILVEEGDIEKVSTKIVFRWWSNSYALTPQTLEYADLYIYSNLNEWADWLKCEVEEVDGTSYYCLDLTNVETIQYEFTAVLYYSNQEIPEPTDTSLDSDWWSSHRVDYNLDPSANSYFTPSGDYIEGGIIYVDHDAKQSSLSYILLESGYILDNSITLSLDLTYNNESVSPNSSGSYYFSYGWTGQDGWSDPEALSYNVSTGKYEITLDSLYATTYEYDVMFVYTNQEYDYWTHKLTSADKDMTFHWNDSGTHQETVSLDVDPSPFGHDLVMGEAGTLTVYFSITQWNVDYDVGLGYNLYICGAWDSWASFYLCTYDYSYVAGTSIFYRAVLPITASGNYEFKILKCPDNNPSWSGEAIVDTDNSGNACMYVDTTAISAGYSLQYFYVSGGSGNWQEYDSL